MESLYFQTAETAPVLTQFFVGGRRFAGGHRVGFRSDLRSLGLKSLINARISLGSRPISLLSNAKAHWLGRVGYKTRGPADIKRPIEQSFL